MARGYLAMPDNGFGSKANSRSFLLRVYAVEPRWRTGGVAIRGAINLRDPNHRIPFELVTEGTQQRYLTGGDFDIESFRIDRRGTLWFGDEFGPFLLHTDTTGKVLEEPIPLPGVRSPDNPLPGPGPNLASSNGFEGMAISPDGRTLTRRSRARSPTTPTTIRRSYTFDIAKRRYRASYRVYHVAALDSRRFVSLERDNFQGTTQLRLDGPQPGAARLQRLHPRAGARAGGAPLASAASPSCHSEKLISPHSCREWSSRRPTCSSTSRVTAAGSK